MINASRKHRLTGAGARFIDGRLFADNVTHEVAHLFHNNKREPLGLPCARSQEWLLDLAFAKRETFAYACEAYGRILELAHGKADRQALLMQYARGPKPPDDTVAQTQLPETKGISLEDMQKRLPIGESNQT